ncbi:hypothetical protein JCM12294_09630 [Desulfocicer niacini]
MGKKMQHFYVRKLIIRTLNKLLNALYGHFVKNGPDKEAGQGIFDASQYHVRPNRQNHFMFKG